MTKVSIPTPNECLGNPELAPLALLEAAIETACHALAAGESILDLDQEWVPSWRLPRTGQGWVTYWIRSAATELREALRAYRHTLCLQGQIRLLPDPQANPDRPF